MKRLLAVTVLLLLFAGLISAADDLSDFYGILESAGNNGSSRSSLDYSSEEKAAIKAAADSEGYDVAFGTDGSMTIKEKDSKEAVTFMPDGSVKGVDENGNSFYIGVSSEWPKNDYTRMLPDPAGYGIKVLESATAIDGFGATIDCSIDQAKRYAAALKAKGFSIDVEEVDDSVPEYGVLAYSFEGENSQGYSASIVVVSAFGNKQCAIGLTKE